MDALFPSLPKDLAKLTDKEVFDLLAEHEEAAGLIDANDEEFLKGLSEDEELEQYKQGAEQILTLRAEVTAREDAVETYKAEKAKIKAEITGEEVEPEVAPEETDPEDETNPADPEPEVVEPDPAEDDPEVTDPVAEKVLVTASATSSNSDVEIVETPRMRRAVPKPASDRVVVSEPETRELSFVASGMLPTTPPGTKFESQDEIVGAMQKLTRSLGAPTHRVDGREERFPVAQLDYSGNFPEERTLHAGDDWQANRKKIEAIGSPFFGREGRTALAASGGLCAPRTPFYTQPNWAVTSTPAWDSLPSFRAERGGVNVPVPTTITDADGSITVITEAEDALGGTYALKACLDMECPDYIETDVTIVSACREFGNLNAMAWPEKIAHENELTRALHARTVEMLVLDRIKAQSIAVSGGAETLGALIYLVDSIVKARFGIISRLRMDPETVFRVLIPSYVPDLLQLDTISTQYDRFRSEEELVSYLRGLDIDPVFYIDTPSTGDSQIADTAQTAAAIDPFPDTIQWGIYPEGAFLGIDMAELNLGIVRDSTLNSTNDFQIFYETFQNVALLGPAQSAYWVTSDLCPTGQFPAAGTAQTCA